MKLLTINTHSIVEEDYEEKCKIFTDVIASIKPDVIAMQEVNQRTESEIASSPEVFGFSGENSIPLKTDNHALKISKMLREYGEHYLFCWEGMKHGFGKFDEGLAIFSREPIENSKSFCLTENCDYENSETRKALLVKTFGKIFVCVHTGKYEGEKRAFSGQLERLNEALKPYKNDEVMLMGDFNVKAHEKGGGYEKILESGWIDTYNEAMEKDDGYTVCGEIDGWASDTEKKRIDYIFINTHQSIITSKVIFDGKNEKRISDHNGVLVEM